MWHQSPYSQLFSLPGGIQFSSAALLGRLPAGMIGLAILMPITIQTGSYMQAGLIAAATMIGMALGAPISGRLVDRFGQFKILLIFAFLNFLATFALILAVYHRFSMEALSVFGLLAGATRLSTGTLARSRWGYVTKHAPQDQQSTLLQSAYAFEAILDEVVFISAPVVATFLCTAIHPLAGLVCCLVSFCIGALLLAVQRKTEPPICDIGIKKPTKLFQSGLPIIFIAVLFIGMSAGAVEVIVVARADAENLRHWVGLLMASLAISSAVSGFWYGAQVFKQSPPILWFRCLGILILALLPIIFSVSMISLMVSLIIAGLAIAPTSIAGQLLTEKILPKNIFNEGMSLVVTAMILGMALGSWLSGVLIDQWGIFLPGVIPCCTVLIASLIVLSTLSVLMKKCPIDE